MAEQEKDNTMTVVIAVTLIAIVGVFLLKSRETEHLSYAGPSDVQQEAQVLSKHQDFNNDVLSEAE